MNEAAAIRNAVQCGEARRCTWPASNPWQASRRAPQHTARQFHSTQSNPRAKLAASSAFVCAQTSKVTTSLCARAVSREPTRRYVTHTHPLNGSPFVCPQRRAAQTTPNQRQFVCLFVCSFVRLLVCRRRHLPIAICVVSLTFMEVFWAKAKCFVVKFCAGARRSGELGQTRLNVRRHRTRRPLSSAMIGI